MKEAKKHKLSDVFGKFTKYIVILFAVLFLISLIRSLVKITGSKKQIDEARGRVEKLQSENESLKNKLALSQSEAFIEQQLRDKLGLAKEGEMVVVLPEPSILKQYSPKIVYEEEILPDPTWKMWFRFFY